MSALRSPRSSDHLATQAVGVPVAGPPPTASVKPLRIRPLSIVCLETIQSHVDPNDDVAPLAQRTSTDAQVLLLDTNATERLQFGISSVRLRSTLQLLATTLPILMVDVVNFVALMSLAITLIEVIVGNSVQIAFLPTCFAGLVIHVAIAIPLGLFRIVGQNPVTELRNGIYAGALAAGLAIVAFGLSDQVTTTKLFGCFVAMSLFATLGPLARILARAAFSFFPWWGVKAVVIGDGRKAQRMQAFYRAASSRGIRPMGVVGSRPMLGVVDEHGISHGVLRANDLYLGSLDELDRLHHRHAFRLAIIAAHDSPEMNVTQVTEYVQTLISDVIVPIEDRLPSLWCRADDLAGMVGIHCRNRLARPVSMLMKRFTDATLSLLLLALLSPVFVFAALAIRCCSAGPVVFRHTRIGRGGKPFRAWKFRTMVVDADARLQLVLASDPILQQQWKSDQKLRNDPRIIPVIGTFLRKTSLDELPQLVNVLLGEMSLVGPRPIVANEIAKYRDEFKQYIKVRPGITGLWQVSGRNDTSYDERVSLDGYYVRNWSFSLDLYLLLRTIRTALLGEGAY